MELNLKIIENYNPENTSGHIVKAAECDQFKLEVKLDTNNLVKMLEKDPNFQKIMENKKWLNVGLSKKGDEVVLNFSGNINPDGSNALEVFKKLREEERSGEYINAKQIPNPNKD